MAYNKDKEPDEEKKSKTKTLLSSSDLRDLINKKSGKKIVNTIDVMGKIPYWISTRSTILDYTIKQGGIGGIPGGRISEMAARPGGGKSFLALEICKSAIELGLDVFYFDSEGGVHEDFVTALGIDKEKFNHCIIHSAEQMFGIIDTLLNETKNRYLFVLDSLAATPTESEVVGGYDPSSQISPTAKVFNLNLKKLMVPLMERESTLLILNQIRDNMMVDKWEKLRNPYRVPGGFSVTHSYSLRLWLFPSDNKDNAVTEEDVKIGNYVKVKIRKSRYRTTDREAGLILVWSGNKPRVMDEETWLDVLNQHEKVKTGAWCNIILKDGTDIKFRRGDFPNMCRTDPKIRESALEYLKELLIDKWNPEEVPEESPALAELAGGT